MPPSQVSRLILLTDQVQIALEERDRLRLLGTEPTKREAADTRKRMLDIKTGLEQLELEPESADGAKRLAARYEKLLEQYHGESDETDAELVYVPRPPQALKASKSVRFRENLVDEPPSPVEPGPPRPSGGRNPPGGEQFIQPYRDDPAETSDGASAQDMYLEQQQTMRDQDEHLDRLASSVSRQHELSIQIEDELGSHIEMLDQLDTLTDSSQAHLETAKRRLERFSRAARGNSSMLTIAILFVLFLILVIVL